MNTVSNVASSEIDKFSQHASSWWDEQGPLKTLHQVNPVRLNWIRQLVDLNHQKVVDIGCGGGILTEALARSGAQATGVDMALDSIEVARLHALSESLQIDYQVKTAEQLAAEQPAAFDVVTCMEMLEHVPEPASVIRSCAQLVKSGGLVFFSTLNRHPVAFALGIVAAEHILNWIPKGTHQYKTFIKPSELAQQARQVGLEVIDIKGIGYAPWRDKVFPFTISDDTRINYMMVARKI